MITKSRGRFGVSKELEGSDPGRGEIRGSRSKVGENDALAAANFEFRPFRLRLWGAVVVLWPSTPSSPGQNEIWHTAPVSSTVGR